MAARISEGLPLGKTRYGSLREARNREPLPRPELFRRLQVPTQVPEEPFIFYLLPFLLLPFAVRRQGGQARVIDMPTGREVIQRLEGRSLKP